MAECDEQGNVVQEMAIGNTQVKICDDYCRSKSPEEVDAALKRIARNALAELNAIRPEDGGGGEG